ncbi:MAG: helix-turn-helix domain-containing protein [Chitinophagaceae bacterium]|nr:helix-turn-helix domain-containing protein [Chitinophagaceae bacterium]
MRNQVIKIGEKIRARRELLGLLQSQLASIAEVGIRTIQMIESGKGNPSLETLLKLIHPIGLQLELTVPMPEKNIEQ